MSQFKLNVNILYGEVRVMISDSENKIIKSEEIRKSKEYSIENSGEENG